MLKFAIAIQRCGCYHKYIMKRQTDNLTIRLPKELKQRVSLERKTLKMTLAEVVREALLDWLKKNNIHTPAR